MILIADSGSTKCDWALLDENFNPMDRFATMGLNPYFHSPEDIANALKDHSALATQATKVTHLFFYGAGSSSDKLCAIMLEGLERVFPQARIVVDHDLVGAAYATYTGEPSVACIIGTGSNSVYFDGVSISEEVPALAYIVGDEGSGSYFGKQILRAYFYKKMPADLLPAFEANYAPTKDEFVDRVYNQADANVYLASFMKFVGEHRSHPWMQQMIEQSMADFLEIHVKCYSNWKEVPVHFVGSGAHYFEEELRRVGQQMGMRIVNIIRKPIDGLVAYHREYKRQEIVRA